MEYPIIGENEGCAVVVDAAGWTRLNVAGHRAFYIRIAAMDAPIWYCFMPDDSTDPTIDDDTTAIDTDRTTNVRIPNVAMQVPQSVIGIHRMVMPPNTYLALRAVNPGTANVRVVKASANTPPT